MGMNIIYKKTSDLIPYENNPRKNDDAVDKVALSISAFGFRVPIVVDKNNVIVCGHTRLKSAKKLGMDEVPCVVADDLTEEQIKAFRLADNKVAEFSNWDFGKLMEELDSLESIDMSVYGFLDKEEPSKEELEKEGGELADNLSKPVVIKIICANSDTLRRYEENIRQCVDDFEGVKVSVGGYDDLIE